MSIGIDIVSIERLEGWVNDEHMIDTVFTENEKASIFKKRIPCKHIAGRFAAKEATMKALGTGWSKGIGWKDIEVLSNTKGKPFLNLTGKAAHLADIKKASLSITYTPEFAIAMVVIQD